MDILAHAFWTNALYYTKYQKEKIQRYWAIFFGVMPDLISFTPAFIYLIFSRGKGLGIEAFFSNLWIYRWAAWSYNWTHSFVSFVIVMLVVTIVRKGKQYWPLWGWALHISVDIFSHKGFYETPFLYPLSHYKFDHGIPWSHPVFMLVNYSLLAIIYLFWFVLLRKKHGKAA